MLKVIQHLISILRTIRQIQGRGAIPEPGDKVISLSNHWDIFSNDYEANLINGTIGYLGEDFQKIDVYYPLRGVRNFPNPVPILKANFIPRV